MCFKNLFVAFCVLSAQFRSQLMRTNKVGRKQTQNSNIEIFEPKIPDFYVLCIIFFLNVYNNL